ncbi:MAG TPA: TIGR03086 family metal-binding protein [Pseudonocardiaceae bacterium]|nr:TIGR03086 family metal-binding protein [Pseudonocardiaceae bacterium]
MEPMEAFDRAAAAVTAVVAGITDEQYGLPSPCTEWTVRNVLNHIVTGNLLAEAIVGGQSHPDRSVDRLGRDPKRAFADSLAATREALSQPGLMERTVTTPMGEAPGSTLVDMRVAELVVHGWDLATATSQSTDIDPELADRVLRKWQARLGDRPRTLTPFADAQPVGDDASAADRLAAYLGRSVVVA